MAAISAISTLTTGISASLISNRYINDGKFFFLTPLSKQILPAIKFGTFTTLIATSKCFIFQLLTF